MTTLVEVVYPSTSSFSGTTQLNIGPYFVPSVNRLLRAEVRGLINFQGEDLADTGVLANFQLWALQWVPHTAAPADCVTTADGPNWLIREQTGAQDTLTAWAPSTDTAAILHSRVLKADWAGQLPIGGDIDLWLSLKPPTGSLVANQNLFASIRWWWA